MVEAQLQRHVALLLMGSLKGPRRIIVRSAVRLAMVTPVLQVLPSPRQLIVTKWYRALQVGYPWLPRQVLDWLRSFS